MLTIPSPQHIYLACEPTDLRKSIDALAALVKEGFGLNSFAPSLFVFRNRQRDKLKLLFWDPMDFGCCTAGSSAARFSGQADGDDVLTVFPRQLRWLLDRLTVEQRKAHPPVQVQAAI